MLRRWQCRRPRQGAHAVFVPDQLETIDEVSSLLADEPDAVDELRRPGIDVERVAGPDSTT